MPETRQDERWERWYEWLTKTRELREWTQAQAAEAAGMKSVQLWSRYENKAHPRPDKVIELARALGASENDALEAAGYDPRKAVPARGTTSVTNAGANELAALEDDFVTKGDFSQVLKMLQTQEEHIAQLLRAGRGSTGSASPSRNIRDGQLTDLYNLRMFDQEARMAMRLAVAGDALSLVVFQLDNDDNKVTHTAFKEMIRLIAHVLFGVVPDIGGNGLFRPVCDDKRGLGNLKEAENRLYVLLPNIGGHKADPYARAWRRNIEDEYRRTQRNFPKPILYYGVGRYTPEMKKPQDLVDKALSEIEVYKRFAEGLADLDVSKPLVAHAFMVGGHPPTMNDTSQGPTRPRPELSRNQQRR